MSSKRLFLVFAAVVMVSLTNTSCLKLEQESHISGEGSRTITAPKKLGPKISGTVNLDVKKKVNLKKYLEKDFDRAIITNNNGASLNLPRSIVSRKKTFWFTKFGKTSVTLLKGNEIIFEENLK